MELHFHLNLLTFNKYHYQKTKKIKNKIIWNNSKDNINNFINLK